MRHRLTSGPSPISSVCGVRNETVANMGAVTLPCEMSGDAGLCCRDPFRTSR